MHSNVLVPFAAMAAMPLVLGAIVPFPVRTITSTVTPAPADSTQVATTTVTETMTMTDSTTTTEAMADSPTTTSTITVPDSTTTASTTTTPGSTSAMDTTTTTETMMVPDSTTATETTTTTESTTGTVTMIVPASTTATETTTTTDSTTGTITESATLTSSETSTTSTTTTTTSSTTRILEDMGDDDIIIFNEGDINMDFIDNIEIFGEDIEDVEDGVDDAGLSRLKARDLDGNDLPHRLVVRDSFDSMWVSKAEIRSQYNGMEPKQARDQLGEYLKAASNVFEIAKPALHAPYVNDSVDMAYTINNLVYYTVNGKNNAEITRLVASMPNDVRKSLELYRQQTQDNFKSINEGDYPAWDNEVMRVTVTSSLPYTLVTGAAVQYTTTITADLITSTPVITSTEAFTVTTTLEAIMTATLQRPIGGAAASNVPLAIMAGAAGAVAFGAALL